MKMAVRGDLSEWSSGWKPLVAGFLGLATGWNVAHIMSGLFIKPMQAEFGWSRTELSFAPIASLIVAALLPFVGMVVDRIGARRVAAVGLCALSSAYLFLSLVPADKFLFWCAVAWLGVAGSISTSVVFARGVTAWFSKNLGTAIGLMMTGASIAPAIGAPLLSGIIESEGWRVGFRALSITVLVVGMPLLLLWFREPSEVDRAGGGEALERDSMKAILKTSNFWKLAIASAIAALPIGGFIGHLIPLLSDQGLPPTIAAGFASVFAISVGIGRVLNGSLLDRFHPPLVTLIALVLAGGGAALLSVFGANAIPLLGLVGIIGLIGMAQGAEGDYIKFFSMRLFGLGNFARVVALMAMTISLFMALGGLVFAWVFDRFGSYEPAILGSVLLYALGGLVFLTINMNQKINRHGH